MQLDSIKTGAPPALGHAALAMEEGFFMEAAALYESVIEHQLLRYYNSLNNSDVRFSSLSALAGKLNGILNSRDLSEPEAALKDMIFDLELWCRDRVAARHALAEVEEEKRWKKALKAQKKQAKQARKFYKKIRALLEKIEQEEVSDQSGNEA